MRWGQSGVQADTPPDIELYGKPLYLLLNFAVTLKML